MSYQKKLLALLSALAITLSVSANPAIEKLVGCLGDSTSGKDRKDLAKWIFTALASHPEIGAITKPKPELVEQVQKNMGALVTKLISESCSNEMRAVVKSEGTNGVKIGFEYLGKMAMQELMSNQEVNAAIGGFERFVDKGKLDSVLNTQP